MASNSRMRPDFLGGPTDSTDSDGKVSVLVGIEMRGVLSSFQPEGPKQYLGGLRFERVYRLKLGQVSIDQIQVYRQSRTIIGQVADSDENTDHTAGSLESNPAFEDDIASCRNKSIPRRIRWDVGTGDWGQDIVAVAGAGVTPHFGWILEN